MVKVLRPLARGGVVLALAAGCCTVRAHELPVKPRLYQCCGTEDFLYADNVRFRDVVRKLPLDLTYEEGPGEHAWAYWDKMIQNVLKWMLPNGKNLKGLIGI